MNSMELLTQEVKRLRDENERLLRMANAKTLELKALNQKHEALQRVSEITAKAWATLKAKEAKNA